VSGRQVALAVITLACVAAACGCYLPACDAQDGVCFALIILCLGAALGLTLCEMQPPRFPPQARRWVIDHHARNLAIRLVDIIRPCLRDEEANDAVHEFTAVLREGLAEFSNDPNSHPERT
jgi:hypothetical protein